MMDKIIIILLCTGIVFMIAAVVIFIRSGCMEAIRNMNMMKKGSSDKTLVSGTIKDMYYKKAAAGSIEPEAAPVKPDTGFVKRDVMPAQEDTAFLIPDMAQIKKDSDLTQPLQYGTGSTALLKEEPEQDTAEL